MNSLRNQILTVFIMGRKRTDPKNKGLPQRWRYTRNAYYYQVPPGLEPKWDGKKTFKLGVTLSEAHRTWAERIEISKNVRTVSDLLERYSDEIVPTKARSTQSLNHIYIRNLKTVFGHFLIDQIEPQYIYQYVDQRRKKCVGRDGKTRGGLPAAKREVAMFSDAYTKAIRWGYIKIHPFKGQVVLDGEKPRQRYIEDWELKEFFSLRPINRRDSTLTIQAYAVIKLLTGLRTQDILTLRISQFTDEGIIVKPLKTRKSSGKEITIRWSKALREAVKYALDIRPVDISPYLFCKRDGGSYYNVEKEDPSSGWKSCFKRYMDRVVRETAVEERFTDHDLRAKCASDMESDEAAMILLAHTSIEMTKKAYRRKPVKVLPAK